MLLCLPFFSPIQQRKWLKMGLRGSAESAGPVARRLYNIWTNMSSHTSVLKLFSSHKQAQTLVRVCSHFTRTAACKMRSPDSTVAEPWPRTATLFFFSAFVWRRPGKGAAVIMTTASSANLLTFIVMGRNLFHFSRLVMQRFIKANSTHLQAARGKSGFGWSAPTTSQQNHFVWTLLKQRVKHARLGQSEFYATSFLITCVYRHQNSENQHQLFNMKGNIRSCFTYFIFE